MRCTSTVLCTWQHGQWLSVCSYLLPSAYCPSRMRSPKSIISIWLFVYNFVSIAGDVEQRQQKMVTWSHSDRRLIAIRTCGRLQFYEYYIVMLPHMRMAYGPYKCIYISPIDSNDLELFCLLRFLLLFFRYTHWFGRIITDGDFVLGFLFIHSDWTGAWLTSTTVQLKLGVLRWDGLSKQKHKQLPARRQKNI